MFLWVCLAQSFNSIWAPYRYARMHYTETVQCHISVKNGSHSPTIMMLFLVPKDLQ